MPNLKGSQLKIVITKPSGSTTAAGTTGMHVDAGDNKASGSSGTPYCRYVNVELLEQLVSVVFNTTGKALEIYKSRDKSGKLTHITPDDVKTLHGQTLYAYLC
ncbi:hypothetical protein MRX96_011500 [Rhipicephalus microplus]